MGKGGITHHRAGLSVLSAPYFLKLVSARDRGGDPDRLGSASEETSYVELNAAWV